MKKIGFDMDGVISDYNTPFVERTITITEKNLFPKEWWETGELVPDPPVWHYPTHFGYTDEEYAAVLAHIKNDVSFWSTLPPLPGMKHVSEKLLFENSVYFITNRVGVRVKRQSEEWVRRHLTANAGWVRTSPRSEVTILISPHKGIVAHALNLDLYIDDNIDNIISVAHQSPHTKAYLLKTSYNKKRLKELLHISAIPVGTVEEMMKMEGLDG